MYVCRIPLDTAGHCEKNEKHHAEGSRRKKQDGAVAIACAAFDRLHFDYGASTLEF